MHHPLASAIVLLAASLLATGTQAQPAYKCESTYSQTPCPSALIIDTADPRTSAQKKQTDLATERAIRAANTMEQARLEQEQRHLAANASPHVSIGQTGSPAAPRAKKPKKKTETAFTAQGPGTKGKGAVARRAKKSGAPQP